MIIRTYSYRVSTEENGIRLSNFLKRRGYSAQNCTELRKKLGLVQINDADAKLDMRVKSDDCINVNIDENADSRADAKANATADAKADHKAEDNTSKSRSYATVAPVKLPFEIIYEDEDILVVNKPAGMPTHVSHKNRDNTLANAVAYYYAQKNRPFVFRGVNRLDRDTSGLCVIALNYLTANILCGDFAKKRIRKEYLGIVRGEVIPSKGTIDIPIGRLPGSVIERVPDPQKGESALTEYEMVNITWDAIPLPDNALPQDNILKKDNSYSLLRLIPHTGRTHQLRVHMKYLGYPLIGDYLYNPDYEKMNRQALHAYKLELEHPITKQMMEFTAPLPEDMKWILEPGTEVMSV